MALSNLLTIHKVSYKSLHVHRLHHVLVFGYPMKNWMKIFKDLDIVSKPLEIWMQYPNVHWFLASKTRRNVPNVQEGTARVTKT